MWRAKRAVLSESCELIAMIDGDGRLLTNGEVLSGWHDNAEFREFFISTLASNSFSAFFWETKPFTQIELVKPFEFVLIRSEVLAETSADLSAFVGYLNKPDHIVTFPNLSGDSILVVPNQISDLSYYGHIAVFMRSAPSEQRHALLQLLAIKAAEKIAALQSEPIWISTAGLGVPWLHVRIDAYPKYYRYKAYT